MNDVIADALRLAKYIFNTLAPKDEWIITTLVKSEEDNFTSPFKDYKTAFGYRFDRTLKILRDENIFEAEEKDMWFMEITDMKKRYEGKIIRNGIASCAWKMGYIPKNKVVFTTFNVNDYGRAEYGGVVTVLITKGKLKRFVEKYSNLTPAFDVSTGEFKYKEEKIFFSGKVEKASLKLLVENFNKIVTKKVFYEIPRNYQNEYNDLGKNTSLDDASEKIINKIRKKIYSIKLFYIELELRQKDGFGLFSKTR